MPLMTVSQPCRINSLTEFIKEDWVSPLTALLTAHEEDKFSTETLNLDPFPLNRQTSPSLTRSESLPALSPLLSI